MFPGHRAQEEGAEHGLDAEHDRREREDVGHHEREFGEPAGDPPGEEVGAVGAARVCTSLSTRDGFGITFAEALAANCTVTAADHPDSAVDEVIGKAGFLTEPTTEGVAAAVDRALNGERPPQDPQERARRYDWDTVAQHAESTYRRAVEGHW